MERLVLSKLLEWKNSEYRKPLLLKGARGVGKTWLLKEFGNRYYQNTAYFNFEDSPEYQQFFETTKDAHRILDNLIMASGQNIEKTHTLIIFDEIHGCPNVINALKYFCENASDYHLACAVSQDLKTSPSAFPVGKVDFLQINPMTFTEFLMANNDLNLVNFMDSIDEITPIADAFFNPLYEKLKMYFVTGGMPESVLMWTENKKVQKIQEALSNILQSYEADFGKHPNVNELTGIKLSSLLEDGIKYAILCKPNSSMITIKKLFNNIISIEIPDDDFDVISEDLKKLNEDPLNDFAKSIFGVYCDLKTESFDIK